MVLKITAIHSRHHRDVAEKEAKLLQKLSHPSIVRMFDACYRGSSAVTTTVNGLRVNPQHMILMEYCEGGNSLTMINELKQANKRFDLPSLIIAFGQICNAVSYLHAQRPPIVHRDLKPVNFLIKNGAYKLGDFGSAVIGHVDLKTPEARQAAEEVVQKTTTQMFRSPEMVDLFMAKRLTQSTDIWALGCCLYSLAFFQNCFEEGSNLAILSSNYKIPEDNPYGEGIAELIRRMLTVNYKERADISEVILCLSALYSDRSLPPRKLRERNTKSIPKTVETEKNPRIGTFRTDGQGIKIDTVEEPTSKAVEVRFIVFSFLVHVFIISLDSILPFLGQKTESQLCRF
jgi:serine/threonine protein kinase